MSDLTYILSSKFCGNQQLVSERISRGHRQKDKKSPKGNQALEIFTVVINIKNILYH